MSPYRSNLPWFYRSLLTCKGLTLIELLVVVIIIAILGAIALPSMLNQAIKARESQAKTNIGAVNRAQQAYRLANPTFTDDLASLQIGFSDTPDYEYQISHADSDYAQFQATPERAELKAFTGCTYATYTTLTTTQILEAAPSGSSTASPPACPDPTP
ncbi:type IV pilin PilA [Thermosynechococcus sp. NK55a]|jgi:type IV pilus assembly protein PilA|uniref:type IV pilin-like G/H family protein n=1 Tax=unclassified Thermosynechococcus TaxID=2622553 RepID=UPI0003D92126|nr:MULTISPECIES: type IV pilin-like G/H family protein [unclassified Thermosynechococcus]AHB87421.1 type IV pilin PilA [Thermosynechococcus sp. NK55a]RMD80183.1 MAG: prepilin-type N-terminal cleavage/methylation domain-containing protein [Chloroflexota bacterium]HIK24193.1 prepilin-type N-terminal cleavage/methylation domain-containing protein [Thermosynechococcus sp. M3746_W2019_013]